MAFAREDYVFRQAARRAAGILPEEGERSLGCTHGIPAVLFGRGLGDSLVYRSRLWSADGWRQPGVKQSWDVSQASASAGTGDPSVLAKHIPSHLGCRRDGRGGEIPVIFTLSSSSAVFLSKLIPRDFLKSQLCRS